MCALERQLFLCVYVGVALALTGVAAATLWWMLHAWRTPEVLLRTAFHVTTETPKLSFSLIVPARHEEAVLASTLLRMADLDHPAVEVLAVVGHDDEGTRA